MTKGKNFMGGKWQKWYGGGNGYGGEMTRHRQRPSGDFLMKRTKNSDKVKVVH